MCEGKARLRLTEVYMEATIAALTPLASRQGSVPLHDARTAVGKATRVAQVAPEAPPFVASL